MPAGMAAHLPTGPHTWEHTWGLHCTALTPVAVSCEQFPGGIRGESIQQAQRQVPQIGWPAVLLCLPLLLQ